MIAAGNILGELTEKRSRLPLLQADQSGTDENMFERGVERQLRAGQEGGEARVEERLHRGQRGLGQILGSADLHLWDHVCL